MKITGTWEGYYEYGPDYGFGRVVRVPFRMSLSESWFGRLRGQVRDDAARGGMPEQGRVDGKHRWDQVRFVKTMPNHYVMTEDGSTMQELHAAYERQGIEIIAKLPPHRICYLGDLSEDGMAMAGDWEIVPYAIEAKDGAYLLGQGSGTWAARRVSAAVSAV